MVKFILKNCVLPAAVIGALSPAVGLLFNYLLFDYVWPGIWVFLGRIAISVGALTLISVVLGLFLWFKNKRINEEQ